jgi:hypothetical protein
MCGEKRHGTVSETLQNLRQPMPLGRKIRLVLRNTWLKIRNRSDCCGNYGEPGC